MVDDATVEKIVDDAGKLTRAEKLLWGLAAFSAVVGITGTSVAISTHYAQSNTANCINANQGVRNQPNNADRAASDRLAAAQAALDRAQTSALMEAASAPQRVIPDLVAAGRAYAAAYDAFTAQRNSDDAARAAHPIGKC